jgi:hypothetical protein
LVRRRIVIAVAVVVVAVCAGVGVLLWGPADPGGIRDGDAFGGDDGSYQITLPNVLAGEDLWYLAPTPTNHSAKKLTLEDIQPGTVPDGVTFVAARMFKKDDFVAGVPLTWDTGDGPVDNPSTRPSSDVKGYPLLPGQTLPDDDLVYLHLRVTTTTRPLELNGVKFIYEQDGKRYAQTVGANVKLATPSPTPG